MQVSASSDPCEKAVLFAVSVLAKTVSPSQCSSAISCQSCQLMWRSCRESVYINHQHRTDSTHTCRCQAVTTEREPFSAHFPSPQRVRMMKRVSFVTWRAEKAGVFQAPQPLREEDSLVADAAVLRLPGILLLPGITLPSIELLQCWKKSICPSSMSWQRICEAIQIATIHSTEERARMQVSISHHCERTIPSTLSISQRVRPMKSVSFTTSKAQKAGVFQAPQPLCEEDSLVADAAVLRLPGILSHQKSCCICKPGQE